MQYNLGDFCCSCGCWVDHSSPLTLSVFTNFVYCLISLATQFPSILTFNKNRLFLLLFYLLFSFSFKLLSPFSVFFVDILPSSFSVLSRFLWRLVFVFQFYLSCFFSFSCWSMFLAVQKLRSTTGIAIWLEARTFQLPARRLSLWTRLVGGSGRPLRFYSEFIVACRHVPTVLTLCSQHSSGLPRAFQLPVVRLALDKFSRRACFLYAILGAGVRLVSLVPGRVSSPAASGAKRLYSVACLPASGVPGASLGIDGGPLASTSAERRVDRFSCPAINGQWSVVFVHHLRRRAHRRRRQGCFSAFATGEWFCLLASVNGYGGVVGLALLPSFLINSNSRSLLSPPAFRRR